MRQVLYLESENDFRVKYNGAQLSDVSEMYKKCISIEDGKGHVIPFFVDEHTRVTRGTYDAGRLFEANFTWPETDIVPEEDYTIIFVKKGVPFNERNKWTFTQRAKATDTLETLIAAAKQYVNNNPQLGLDMTNIKATTTDDNDFSDYNIILADGWATGTVEILSAIKPEFDAEAIKELLSKAAADSGFEYTNNDNSVEKMYPGYNTWATNNAPDQFTVYTIFQAEPRMAAKPLDMSVNQVIQVIVPKANVRIAILDDLFEPQIEG